MALLCQSHMLCNAHLLDTGLSLIWSPMGQSHLLSNAHLLETADTGRKVGFPVVTSVQDFCRMRVFQMSYSNPPIILDQTCTSSSPLHFLYNRTYTFPCPLLMWSLPTWPCSPPCHMILIISCTTGVIMWTYTCPYPLLMWSLPGPVVSHAIGFLSFSGVVMWTYTCPYLWSLPGRVVLHAICSLSFPVQLDLSCVYAHPYPLLMWSLPGPVVLHAWNFCQIAIDLLTCMIPAYDQTLELGMHNWYATLPIWSYVF